MPVLDDVASYLAGAGLGLTVATTSASGSLYKVPFPEAAPDAAVSLIVYAGQEAIRAMGTATTSLANAATPVAEVVRFQAVVRKDRDSFESCVSLAENIHKTLDHVANVTLGSTRYLYIKTLGPPAFLGFDGNARPRYFVNAEARKERG